MGQGVLGSRRKVAEVEDKASLTTSKSKGDKVEESRVKGLTISRTEEEEEKQKRRG